MLKKSLALVHLLSSIRARTEKTCAAIKAHSTSDHTGSAAGHAWQSVVQRPEQHHAHEEDDQCRA